MSVADEASQEGERALARAAAVERTSPEEALALIEHALQIAGDRSFRARALILRARAHYFARDLAAATEAASEALTISESLGDVDGVVRARAALGAVFSALGHDEAALEQLDEGARLALHAGVSLEARVRVLAQRASALRDAGRLEQAIAAHARTLPLARDLARPLTISTLLLNQAATATRAGDLDLATRTLEEARATIDHHALDGLRDWLAALDAALALARGDFARARRRAEDGMHAGGDGDARVNSVRTWAQAVYRDPSAEADRDRARKMLGELVDQARERGWLGDLPAICLDLADLCERSGDLEGSVRWHREAWKARDLAEESGRERRLEAERLRIEMARLAIEAEQHRLQSEMLAEKNARLATLSEDRARLLAMVAHDLRSPLTAIYMCIEDQQRAKPEGHAARILKTISLATERMKTLIDETLSTDSIRRGQVSPSFHPVDAVDLVRRCLAGLSPLAERKRIGVRLDAPESLSVTTDAPALSRVVENLVTNALKFTPEHKSVRAIVRHEDSSVVIEVEDEGPGFPVDAAARDQLFELGSKGAARPTADEPSTGIGLSVVRDLVAALGGSVALGNREGGGARVTITLPG
jgi:signal transduction histidine kinase